MMVYIFDVNVACDIGISIDGGCLATSLTAGRGNDVMLSNLALQTTRIRTPNRINLPPILEELKRRPSSVHLRGAIHSSNLIRVGNLLLRIDIDFCKHSSRILSGKSLEYRGNCRQK